MCLMEIPFGISTEGKLVSIPLNILHRNHCSIVGAPGSGKSTLLKTIIYSIANNYNCTQMAVWTDYFYHNSEKCQNNSVIEVNIQNISHDERMVLLIDKLYEEAKNRLQIISLKGVSLYRQVDCLPLLIAVIDDFHPFDYSKNGLCTQEKLMNVLLMSHRVGISIVCSSQLSLSKLNGTPPGMVGLFNVKIALQNFQDNIFDTLNISPNMASVELKEAINSLSSGRTGEFIYYNQYESGAFVSGQVTRQ